MYVSLFFFFSSRRRHTRFDCDWSSDVCSSDLVPQLVERDVQEAPVPVAFAPYVLTQYAKVPGIQVRQSPSINVLIDEYYAGAEWRDAMEGVRAPLRKVLQTQRERCIRKADVLQRALATSEEAA